MLAPAATTSIDGPLVMRITPALATFHVPAGSSIE
jgi:hypothetical protein